jgi:hypothetical protein
MLWITFSQMQILSVATPRPCRCLFVINMVAFLRSVLDLIEQESAGRL